MISTSSSVQAKLFSVYMNLSYVMVKMTVLMDLMKLIVQQVSILSWPEHIHSIGTLAVDLSNETHSLTSYVAHTQIM